MSARRRAIERVRREYAFLAPYYDRLWRRYLSTTIGHTIARLPLTGGERVLDVGCGTGVLLRALADRYPEAELHGVDLTPQMLERAATRLGGRAVLRRGSAGVLAYDDASFDVVVSTNVVHAIPPPHEPVLRDWLRTLRPGGRVVITDWRRDHAGTRAHVLALGVLGRPRYHPHRADQLVSVLRGLGARVDAVDLYRAGSWGLLTIAATKAMAGLSSDPRTNDATSS
jgi:ubiquinone/menaquinone biosynthesis C-methylase UbiE